MDGFHSPSQTVFQFHGCWWYGHDCCLTKETELSADTDTRREGDVDPNKVIIADMMNLVSVMPCIQVIGLFNYCIHVLFHYVEGRQLRL